MATETEKITTIKVSAETKDRLAKLGAKDDSYDQIVSRLLDWYEAYLLGK